MSLVCLSVSFVAEAADDWRPATDDAAFQFNAINELHVAAAAEVATNDEKEGHEDTLTNKQTSLVHYSAAIYRLSGVLFSFVQVNVATRSLLSFVTTIKMRNRTVFLPGHGQAHATCVMPLHESLQEIQLRSMPTFATHTNKLYITT